jgi:hypothetical protein
MTCDANEVSRMQLGLHLAFHSSVAAFFGYFHQAGVVNSLREMKQTTEVTYWKTYMAPSHLLQDKNTRLIDCKGSTFEFALNQTKRYLVAPVHLVPDGAGLKVEKCWWPHVSTENLATSWEDWRLCLFEKEENNKS